jgi:hypothetical protein
MACAVMLRRSMDAVAVILHCKRQGNFQTRSLTMYVYLLTIVSGTKARSKLSGFDAAGSACWRK